MRLALWLALSALVTAGSPGVLAAPLPGLQQPAAATAPVAQPASSKVWIGRYAEYEEFLRTASIERFEGTKVGITLPKRCFFTPGGLAASAICKNEPPCPSRSARVLPLSRCHR